MKSHTWAFSSYQVDWGVYSSSRCNVDAPVVTGVSSLFNRVLYSVVDYGTIDSIPSVRNLSFARSRA